MADGRWVIAAAITAVLLGASAGACGGEEGDQAPSPWAKARLDADSELAAKLEPLLTVRLPEAIIALDHAGAGDGETTLDASACQRLPGLCEGLEDLLEALAAARSFDERLLKITHAAIDESRRRVNGHLAARGVPFFIDAAVVAMDDRRVALAFTYRILSVRRSTSGDAPVVVLGVERADHLNWRFPLYGFSSGADREALVLVDEVRAELAGDLGARLAGRAAEATAEGESDQARELRASALRAELELGDLGERFAERIRLWEQLRHLARTRASVELGLPRDFEMDATVGELARQVMQPELVRALENSERHLRRHPALAGLVDHLVAAVAVHEAQHRLDERGAGLRDPGVELVGGERSTAVAELSAYLAEIARRPASARSSVARLLIIIADPELEGTSDRAVAELVLRRLASRLALPGPPLQASSWTSLPSMDPDRLSTAAAAIWQTLFQRRLPALELR